MFSARRLLSRQSQAAVPVTAAAFFTECAASSPASPLPEKWKTTTTTQTYMVPSRLRSHYPQKGSLTACTAPCRWYSTVHTTNNHTTRAGSRSGAAALSASLRFDSTSPGEAAAAAAAAEGTAGMVAAAVSASTRGGAPTVDAHTSASVVIVDPVTAAKERDRLARETLSTNFPKIVNQHQKRILQLKDVIHTVPYTLAVAVEVAFQPEFPQDAEDTAAAATPAATSTDTPSSSSDKSKSVSHNKHENYPMKGQEVEALNSQEHAKYEQEKEAAVMAALAEAKVKQDAMEAALKARAKGVLDECFAIVNDHLNHFNPKSEVSQVNALPLHAEHTMSPHLATVLQCCVDIYQASGGCYDPATGPLVRRLREVTAAAAADPTSALRLKRHTVIDPHEAEKFTLPNSFEIDFKRNVIARKHSEAALDLGAVNKGYTVDLVIQKLNEAGMKDVLFEWGGDCKATGTNAQHQPWAIGIPRPPTLDEIEQRYLQVSEKAGGGEERPVRFPNGAITELTAKSPPLLRVITLNSEAICTSGDYENLHAVRPVVPIGSAAEDGGELRAREPIFYTSTFDWQTRQLLQPSNDSLALVSVKSYSCLYADALSTACLVKREPVKVRYMLEPHRYAYHRVVDYVAYTRAGERLAHMYEIAKESPERRAERIASALPARVVVVGGGLAGCTAAIEAANCGAQVILLEKESQIGGNSAKATSGINGWGTRAQSERKVTDNCQFFERDTYRSGKGGYCDPGLVRMLSVKSAEAIEWLTAMGVPLTMLYQLGGASRKRCHRVPDTPDGRPVPVGFTIMQTLRQHMETVLKDKITILYNTALVDLLREERYLFDGSREVQVTGVRYKVVDPEAAQRAAAEAEAQEKNGAPTRRMTAQQQAEEERRQLMTLTADAVVLATGGFSNDRSSNSLLREFAPGVFGTCTTNGTFATGDGVKIARRLGASLIDMDKVQLHPTGLIDPKDPANKTKYLGPEALRGSGGILLNQRGDRFVNELDLRSVVSKAIMAQEDVYPNSGDSRFAYCVLSEEAAMLFGKHGLEYYKDQLGLFQVVPDVAALAKLIRCDEDNLWNTLDTYEQLSKQKGNAACPQTGKIVFPSVVGTKGPYYVACVTPSIHYTMGGCFISPAAEILMDDDADLTGTTGYGNGKPYHFYDESAHDDDGVAIDDVSSGDAGGSSSPYGASHQPYGYARGGPARRLHNVRNIFQDKKPILGLFGAGEVTGGVHGGNRLGGNSLLECVVFGKIAGDRAATILQKDNVALPSPSPAVPAAATTASASTSAAATTTTTNSNNASSTWAPVVVREAREGDHFGVGSRVLRFNLPGSLQTSGLCLGQFIAIRGNWDGQQLIGYYSPITLPDDHGRISILARGDKGNLSEWINSMRPGDAVEMKACGGLQVDLRPQKKQILFRGAVIKKFGLIAGGSGVAPMLQLIRAALNPPYSENFDVIRLVYAAEDERELTYKHLLRSYQRQTPDKFGCSFVLNNPPEGWTEGVGYVDKSVLQHALPPPSKDLLIAICGPPVMQRSVKRYLHELGYSDKLVHTVDEGMVY